jgi:L-lactate permease
VAFIENTVIIALKKYKLQMKDLIKHVKRTAHQMRQEILSTVTPLETNMKNRL